MIYDALAFPWLLYSASGTPIARGEGSLFQLPTAADQPTQHIVYSRIKRNGWSKCPLGYAVYARIMPGSTGDADNILILPGLKVRTISTVSGRSEGLTIVTDPASIEHHVDSVLSAENKIRDRFDSAARENIHEIRGINSSLYHAAVELLDIVQRDISHYKHPSDLAYNVVALSETITARLDLISYLTDSQLSRIDIGNVSVFQKFDKIIRSLKPAAIKQKKNIFLYGSSYSLVYGPKGLMELIAYLLLDNAIKYSPESQTIRVDINDAENFVNVTVSSVGPHIAESEIDLIFQRDYRSEFAIQSGKSGSGIGLYALRNLVRGSFQGDISVKCGYLHNRIRDIPYHEIIFSLSIPISRKRDF